MSPRLLRTHPLGGELEERILSIGSPGESFGLGPLQLECESIQSHADADVRGVRTTTAIAGSHVRTATGRVSTA